MALPKSAAARRYYRAAKQLTRHLARLASWSTDLRYATTILKRREADQFLESVIEVATWCDGRM